MNEAALFTKLRPRKGTGLSFWSTALPHYGVIKGVYDCIEP
jgi:hypothetical protein